MDRITLLASLAKDANSLVDVGCDHGYVAIKAIKDFNVKNACLIDINQAPLDNAKKNVVDNKLDDKTCFILSDGLKDYTGECDTLVIAGMGGILISNILKDSIVKAKSFKRVILGANSEVDKLRSFLISNRFVFDNEEIIKDGKKIYEIIVCHFDDSIRGMYSLLDMKFGPILRKKNSALFQEVVNKKEALLNECLSKATDSDGKSKLKVELAFISLLRGNKNGK